LCRAVLLDWVKVNIVGETFDRGYPMDSPLIGGHAGFSPMLPLHFLFYLTLRRAEDPRALLERLCQSMSCDFEVLCRAVAVLPLRFLAASFIISDADVWRVPPLVAPTLECFLANGQDLPSFRALFGHVQLMFGICRDKDAFIRLVTGVFGLSQRLSIAVRSEIELVCLTFISSLLCDYAIFENDKLAWTMGAIAAQLLVGEMSVDTLSAMLAPNDFLASKIKDRLASIVRIEQSRVSLADGSSWHIAQCWGCRQLHKVLREHAAANPDILFPFPTWTDVSAVDLASALRSRYLFALLSDILFKQLTHPSLAVHYALNLFILLANHAPPAAPPARTRVVTGESADALARAIPADFHAFIRTPVYHNLGVPLTLVQLVERLGGLGAKALVHSNIGWSRRSVERPDVAALKAAIVSDYAAKWRAF
jgi:hypothetical protein